MPKHDAVVDTALLVAKLPRILLASMTIAILTFVLGYTNLDKLYGSGTEAILFAAFGASAFILFLLPQLSIADNESFSKSYIAGSLIGALGTYLLAILPLYLVAGIVLLALSVVMYAIGGVHPPGIGIALAFVFYKIGPYGIVVVLATAVMMLIMRIAFERVLLATGRG